MKGNISFKEKDLLVMKLLHYFITEKGYNPIILHGIQDEIWLENMDSPYRIVRIMTGYIHNNNQYDFDMYKTNKIMQKIKLKTFSFKLNNLSIFLDLGDYVELNNTKNIECVGINNEEDIIKSDVINSVFTDIKNKLKFDEKGIELFTKITNDINEKNKKDAKQAEEVLTIKKPIVTYVLIAVNIFVFLLMYIFGKGSNDIDTIINFGALSNIHVLVNHEYYRLITCSFIHIGFLHLFMNMYALYVLGEQLESFYGHIRYLIIYLVSALFGSLISMLFVPASTISAGASGAVFGLLGAFAYFGYHYRAYLSNVLVKQIIPIILINIFIGFSVPEINSAAHFGGLVGGLLISSAVGIKYKTSTFEKTNGWIVTLLFFAFLIYMIFIK